MSEQQIIPEEEFLQIKQESLKLYAYTNRVLKKACANQLQQTMGYALFDKNGCLLKLYGPETYLLWCDSIGLKAKTRWDAESFCETAVSQGLRSRCGSWWHTDESSYDLLQKIDFYFRPLLLSRPGDAPHEEVLGGIAVVAPPGELPSECELICTSLTDDVVLHMFMASELYALYFDEPKGLMNIDINVHTGVPHILYHNEKIFKILGIPYENLYFKRADTFFDPLPENQEFWNIIKQEKVINDERPITLSVRGKKADYLVSTAAYRQDGLGFRGVRFFITTAQEVSRHVAKRLGNNAVYSFSRIIGESPKMQNCIRQAEAIAHSDSNIIITGESGVGKDLFAQAIHNASCRKDKPFIVLNCAAIPRDLLASELFGYDNGAYTGAKKNGNLGKFELADTGTIFLDEIGDMPLDLQVMLLRVIEQKSFMRIGSNVTRNVDVKIISATNADLKTMVEKRTFRPDLYFRLCTLSLRLPPLRERGNDIILLAEYFIDSISARLNRPERKHLSDETKELLLRLPWTGNVRELQNVMERVVQLIPSRIITPQDLSICLDFPLDNIPLPAVSSATPVHTVSSPQHARSTSKKSPITRETILQALEDCHYNRTMAAAYLGVSRKTFYRKLEDLDIKL